MTAWRVLKPALTLSVLVFSTLGTQGCADDFDPGSLIQDLRVLGVSAEVVGDDERTQPRLAEEVQLSVITFAPEENPSFTWTMFACLTEGAIFGGLGDCVGEPLASELVDELTEEAPNLRFTIPEDALEFASQVIVLGVVCPVGVPSLDDLGSDEADFAGNLCRDPDDPGEPFTATVNIDTGQGNQRPRFTEDAISVDGQPWPPLDSTSPDCADPEEGVPVFSRASLAEEGEGEFRDLPIRITGFSREDLEEFTVIGDSPPREIPQQESLQISHFTTAGELERQFSAIDDEENEEDLDLSPEVDWSLPDLEELPELPASGVAVRFAFLVRDGRGGIDSTNRALCIIP